jgi:hypothetical protein
MARVVRLRDGEEGLPDPLVPAEADLRGLRFMPLDVMRLLDSDFYALANGAEFKAGVTLWAKSWNQVPAGSLPDDDRVLQHLSGAGALWPEVRGVALRHWVRCSDGRLYHPVVAEAVLHAWERRSARRRSAHAGAAARWGRVSEEDERREKTRQRVAALRARRRAAAGAVTPSEGVTRNAVTSVTVTPAVTPVTPPVTSSAALHFPAKPQKTSDSANHADAMPENAIEKEKVVEKKKESPPRPSDGSPPRGGAGRTKPRPEIAVALPDWLPADAWDDWSRYRAEVAKARWTQRAAELSLKALDRLRAKGQDPRLVIEQSIANGWTGLFPDKTETTRHGGEVYRDRPGKLDWLMDDMRREAEGPGEPIDVTFATRRIS